MTYSRWMLSILVVSVAACGADTPDETGTDSGTGTDTASSATGTTGATDTAGSCDGFLNEARGDAVTVTFRNDTATDVYLNAQYGCLDSFLWIQDPQSNDVEWRTDGWILTCEQLMAGGATCGGPGCTGSALRITPGGSRTEVWPGVVFESVDLDAACSDDNTCGPTCHIERTPAAGEFTFGAEGVDGLDCGDEACPVCTPDADGACVLYLDLAQLSGTPVTATAPVTLPAETSATLVFE